jgi:hypothetical protein
MAKAAAADSIMAPDKMKPLLALSKREPVQAAIVLSNDGEGIILLDKKAKPKKVASMLKAIAAKAKLQLNSSSLRFGRAEVDTDYDSGMVRFFINKDAPGNMRVKLVEVVKRIPYQKVEINVDPSLEEEPEEEDDGHAEGDAPAAAASAPLSQPAPANPPQAQAQAANIPDGTPDPAIAPLRAELAQLIPQITLAAGNDAELARGMKTDAQEAALCIRKNDVAGATAAIERLKGLLGSATPANVTQPAETQPASAAPNATAASAQTAPRQPAPADASRKALAALIGRIAQAAGDDAARKAELVKLATAANGALHANDLAAAEEAIARLREALDGPAADDDGDGEPSPVSAEGLRARIEDIQIQAATLPDAAKAAVVALAKQTAASINDGDPAKAAAAVDALENAYAEAAGAARVAEAQSGAEGRVELRKTQILWRDAEKQAQARLEALIATVLADKVLQADAERFNELKANEPALRSLIPSEGGTLDEQLGTFDGASSTEERERARQAALNALGDYIDTLDQSEELHELQKLADEDYGGVPFYAGLQKALSALRGQLSS